MKVPQIWRSSRNNVPALAQIFYPAWIFAVSVVKSRLQCAHRFFAFS
jgi:hypothetical protein